LYEIAIKELEFEAIIGILEFERKAPQRVKIECFIGYHDKKEYIDYAKVVEDIKSIMIEKKFLLIEDALDELIEILSQKYPQMKSIKLTISKPDIISECEVSVTKLKKF